MKSTWKYDPYDGPHIAMGLGYFFIISGLFSMLLSITCQAMGLSTFITQPVFHAATGVIFAGFYSIAHSFHVRWKMQKKMQEAQGEQAS